MSVWGDDKPKKVEKPAAKEDDEGLSVWGDKKKKEVKKKLWNRAQKKAEKTDIW
ncbi:MAG: hypothetical protein R3E66_15635 [bacterium]